MQPKFKPLNKLGQDSNKVSTISNTYRYGHDSELKGASKDICYILIIEHESSPILALGISAYEIN